VRINLKNIIFDPDKINIKTSDKLKVIYAVAHLGIIPAFLLGDVFWWISSVAVYFCIQTFCVGIAAHRLFTHRAFVTGRKRELILTYLSVISGLGSSISWAGVHSFHHKVADTTLDPHSPHHMSLIRIWLSEYYDKTTRVDRNVIKRLGKDVHHRFVHTNYFKLLILWQCLLLLFGFKFFIFVFCIPMVLVYNITTLGTILHHVHGYRSHETPCRSYNSWLLSAVTLGDGWHNNHHHNPSSYRHGEKWWEFDIQAFLIKYVFMDRRKNQRSQDPLDMYGEISQA
jgi:fatty-acid desaturase